MSDENEIPGSALNDGAPPHPGYRPGDCRKCPRPWSEHMMSPSVGIVCPQPLGNAMPSQKTADALTPEQCDALKADLRAMYQGPGAAGPLKIEVQLDADKTAGAIRSELNRVWREQHAGTAIQHAIPKELPPGWSWTTVPGDDVRVGIVSRRAVRPADGKTVTGSGYSREMAGYDVRLQAWREHEKMLPVINPPAPKEPAKLYRRARDGKLVTAEQFLISGNPENYPVGVRWGGDRPNGLGCYVVQMASPSVVMALSDTDWIVTLPDGNRYTTSAEQFAMCFTLIGDDTDIITPVQVPAPPALTILNADSPRGIVPSAERKPLIPADGTSRELRVSALPWSVLGVIPGRLDRSLILLDAYNNPIGTFVNCKPVDGGTPDDGTALGNVHLIAQLMRIAQAAREMVNATGVSLTSTAARLDTLLAEIGQ